MWQRVEEGIVEDLYQEWGQNINIKYSFDHMIILSNRSI